MSKKWFSLYCHADSSVVSVFQNDVTIRTNLEDMAEVDFRWHEPGKPAVRYLATILKSSVGKYKVCF